ncbi:hypothetical protein [Shewanella psychrotolerans]|uniref:hypothetical protein n=1 Tax=Shewanella psychrotolerans TaxID=2864206 RepID=UPI001C6610BD|nr:hypothetical protein [Shewanella psychrotolerans]QYK01524.1 hypothetical protein K0I62_00530 [Shewanella psychrotolerans]
MNSLKPKGAKPLLMLLLVFVLPVVVAKLVLSMNLYHGGATNKGQLLTPDTSYSSLAMENPQPKSWQIIYLLPSQCDNTCLDRLYILHQSHIALGRDQNRVKTIILLQPSSDLEALAQFKFDTANISQQLAEMMLEQELIIVDPLGSLVMRYKQVNDKQEQILLGKAMVADLRKMLKLSRVG